jgi:hypothetical protein
MRLSDLSFTLFRFLLPPALIVTLLLYFYAPLFDCSFPYAKQAEAGCSIPGQQKDAVPAVVAPFRLLAFGDPQLEGDTSLPSADAPWFPSLRQLGSRGVGGWGTVVGDLFGKDVPNIVKGGRKRIDLWGNDLYLAHIYRSVSWWTQPTHTVVLGDLLGSQWVGDDEFRRRSHRFWNKVFKGTHKVPRSITESSGRVEVLGDDENWTNRVIAIAGNHDIGYAGDIDPKRIERFEVAFGSVNWAITFRLHNASTPSHSPLSGNLLPSFATVPELRLVILNSMNLDSPAKDEDLQQQSRDFAVEHLSQPSKSPLSATVLLTHIPFHKDGSVCVDETFFDWFSDGGIKEQNHLSKETSHFLLDALTGGPGSAEKAGTAVVLNGHDHEGCQTYHYRKTQPGDGEAQEWQATHIDDAGAQMSDPSMTGVQEITVRSMMGSFYGNAGFLSGWFDQEVGEWKFEYNSCMLGVQHIWWVVHVVDLVVIALGLGGVAAVIVEEIKDAREQPKLKTA